MPETQQTTQPKKPKKKRKKYLTPKEPPFQLPDDQLKLIKDQMLHRIPPKIKPGERTRDEKGVYQPEINENAPNEFPDTHYTTSEVANLFSRSSISILLWVREGRLVHDRLKEEVKRQNTHYFEKTYIQSIMELNKYYDTKTHELKYRPPSKPPTPYNKHDKMSGVTRVRINDLFA